MKKDNKHIILDWFDAGNSGTMRDVYEAVDVNERSVRTIIAELCRSDLLKSIGSAPREIGSRGAHPSIWARTDKPTPVQKRNAPNLRPDRKYRSRPFVENQSIVTRAMGRRTLLEMAWMAAA